MKNSIRSCKRSLSGRDDLSAKEQKVYEFLCDRRERGESMTVKLNEFADETGLARRTIQYALASLKKIGMVVCHRVNGHSTTYEIVAPAKPTQAPEEDALICVAIAAPETKVCADLEAAGDTMQKESAELVWRTVAKFLAGYLCGWTRDEFIDALFKRFPDRENLLSRMIWVLLLHHNVTQCSAEQYFAWLDSTPGRLI